MPLFLPDRRVLARAPLRRPLAVLLAIGLLLPLAASAPAPAAAGGSCTGWTSRTTPPDTIRVGRSDGSVDVVEFRQYVGVVMAAEWPGWVPRQAREAGAVAVKQYAWFHSLEGNHRSSYVNANGKCFDVKDGTADQLYRPAKYNPGDKIWNVVDATWGLSVRKDGKFFMTGYRAGTSSQCASDVDGWKLFAKSVIDCAERGWTREKIQTTYYAPNVTFHWTDGELAPAPDIGLSADLGAPAVDLRTDQILGAKHAYVAWDPAGNRPAGMAYHLQRLVSGDWTTIKLPDPTQPGVALNVGAGRTHQFRVRLRDGNGNAGPWHVGPRFDAVLIQDKNRRIGWSTSDWTRQTVSSASGGTVTYATRAGSQAALRFKGRAVAVVATMGPDRGMARIVINGKVAGEVNLYAPTYRWRVLVYTREWARVAERVIRIEVLDSEAKRVDVDGILFHR